MLELVFWFLFFLVVLGLGLFLFSRREDRAVVSLLLVFTPLGGIFALMGYPFLGAIYVLIYAGAIIVGFLMVVWLIAGRSQEGRSLKCASAVVFVALGLEILILAFSGKGVFSKATGGVKALGHFFLTNYLYVFELTSLLVLTSAVAALVLLRRRG